MLWESHDPKQSLEQKVCQAGEYFYKKYNKTPDTCLVHPSTLSEKEVDVECSFGIIRVLPHPAITPFHYWVGLDGEL